MAQEWRNIVHAEAQVDGTPVLPVFVPQTGVGFAGSVASRGFLSVVRTPGGAAAGDYLLTFEQEIDAAERSVVVTPVDIILPPGIPAQVIPSVSFPTDGTARVTFAGQAAPPVGTNARFCIRVDRLFG